MQYEWSDVMQHKQLPQGWTEFDAAEYLKSDAEIAEYLNASLEMNDPEVMLQAISTAARARGMTQLAKDSGLGRESLYKALALGAKPRYDTIFKVLSALGVRLAFMPEVHAKGKPASGRKRAGAHKAVTAAPRRSARAPAKTGGKRNAAHAAARP
jgi:probable addiction module antidote protein